MKIINSVSEWRNCRKQENFINKSIGLVPTMGNLHKGHQSLLKRSVAENEMTIATIFVNPTQFDNASDFEKYPKTFEQDIKLVEECGVDYLFVPVYKELYPDDYRYRINENHFSQQLCGQHRNGHFDGVLTVVLKLFNLIKPQRAYFGEKDYQQLQLIIDMVEAFFLDIQIISCPIIRDDYGIAYSSRNNRLNTEQYELLKQFPLHLQSNNTIEMIINNLTAIGFEVDYITELNGRRFGAVRLGEIRFIDNIQVD